MVVILILGGPSTTSATPKDHQLLVSSPPAPPPCVSHSVNNYGHSSTGTTATYHRLYNRSVSATNNQRYGCQKTSPHEKTRRPGYFQSLSVPQLSLGQRFTVNTSSTGGDTRRFQPSSTTTATKANQCQSDSDDEEPPPLIRHITRVNICDASSQLDLAGTSNYGAIATTTDAEPVTREGECKDMNIGVIDS